jgi:hypothetical protein
MTIYSLSAELPKRVCGEFRCKICGGFIDGRDLAGFEDHEGRCRTPRKIRCSSSNRGCQRDRERDLVITARRAASRRRKLLFFSICSYGVSPLRHKNVSRFLEHHEGGLAASHQSTRP